MEHVPLLMYASLMASCKACSHAQRSTIDSQIVNGAPYRSIIARFGLSLGCIHRHKTHVKEALAEAIEARQEESAENSSGLLRRVEKLVGECEEILALAKTDKNLKAATNAIGAATRLLELVGKLSGEIVSPTAGGIHFHATKNVTNIVNVRNDDLEIAQLFAEFTRNFDEREIRRLRLLVAQPGTSGCQSETK